MISASSKAKDKKIVVKRIVRQEIIHLIKIMGPVTTRKWCEVLNAIEKTCFQNSVLDKQS